MKYIENPELSKLAQALTYDGECAVHTRIEAYSCKNVKRDKKLFKSLEHAYNDEISNSPPLPSWLALDREAETTPFGPMGNHSSRKTLYLLIATLNIAFPDHEFSDVRPAHFIKEQSGASVLNALSTTLISPHRVGMSAPRTYSAYPPTSSDFFPSSVSSSSSPYNQIIHSPYAPPPIISGTHPSLYRILDNAIGLSECEVFSYSPDIDSDPHANDYSDDEEDFTSTDDGDSSTEEEETTFEFDNYDIDELVPGRHHMAADGSLPIPRAAQSKSLPEYKPWMGSVRQHGALLWSSHWFFLNRKLKRILFISVWARTRRMGSSWQDDYVDELTTEKGLRGERFLGWEGSVGAGARALGLKGLS